MADAATLEIILKATGADGRGGDPGGSRVPHDFSPFPPLPSDRLPPLREPPGPFELFEQIEKKQREEGRKTSRLDLFAGVEDRPDLFAVPDTNPDGLPPWWAGRGSKPPADEGASAKSLWESAKGDGFIPPLPPPPPPPVWDVKPGATGPDFDTFKHGMTLEEWKRLFGELPRNLGKELTGWLDTKERREAAEANKGARSNEFFSADSAPKTLAETLKEIASGAAAQAEKDRRELIEAMEKRAGGGSDKEAGSYRVPPGYFDPSTGAKGGTVPTGVPIPTVPGMEGEKPRFEPPKAAPKKEPAPKKPGEGPSEAEQLQGAMAAGPAGMALYAAAKLKEKAEQLGKGAKETAMGVAGADADKTARGFVEIAGAVPVVGPALKGLAGTVLDVNDQLRGTAERLGRFNGAIAVQAINNDINRLLREIQRASTNQESMVRWLRAQGSFDEAIEKLMDALLPILTSIATVATNVITGILERIEAIRAMIRRLPFMGGPDPTEVIPLRDVFANDLDEVSLQFRQFRDDPGRTPVSQYDGPSFGF